MESKEKQAEELLQVARTAMNLAGHLLSGTNFSEKSLEWRQRYLALCSENDEAIKRFEAAGGIIGHQ